MRLDTSPDRAGQQELRTVTKRSQGPMFRAHEDGFIRCRLARCAAKDLVAAELPPPDRSQSAPEMPRSLFSCPQEPRPQTVERERGRPARARWRAQAWPTDGNCRRSPLQGHPLHERNPSCQQVRGTVGRSTGLDFSRQSALGSCLRRARSSRCGCGAGTPLPIPDACGPCPPRAHRLWQ